MTLPLLATSACPWPAARRPPPPPSPLPCWPSEYTRTRPLTRANARPPVRSPLCRHARASCPVHRGGRVVYHLSRAAVFARLTQLDRVPCRIAVRYFIVPVCGSASRYREARSRRLFRASPASTKGLADGTRTSSSVRHGDRIEKKKKQNS